MSTTYQMQFDFTTADEQAVLQQLQAYGYTLLGYKGATGGSSQLSVGVPTWFSVPFGNIFGITTISYTPTYKVFVSNQGQIAANTTIQMQALSAQTGLGSALTFNQNGSFTSGGVSGVPSDSIGLYNASSSSSPALTVGLAGLVNTPSGNQYLPFCAFTVPPQNSIVMTPNENILLVAAQTNVQSGNVQANVAAPGCSFTFSSQAPSYFLDVVANTFAITNVPGTAPVAPVASGTSIAPVINQSS